MCGTLRPKNLFEMPGKSLEAAKQQRDKHLLEFKAACYDLEGEVEPSGGRTANPRRIKLKMSQVKTSYDDCLSSQSQVYGLEKTSGAEESNWTWVVNNLKKPLNEVIGKAEDLLDTLETPADPEAESKNQLLADKKNAKMELVRFEAKLKAELEGVREVYGETNIWLKENHAALTVQVEELGKDLNEKHIVMSRNYVKYLDDTDGGVENTRAEKFTGELLPILARLQSGLRSKTPAAGPGHAPAVGVQQVRGQAVDTQEVQQAQIRSKFKMAAMSVPKFSGRVIDYPEWRTLFKDCIESQYEESAVVMILRTQSLPSSLTSLVPRCATLTNVWEKLDQQFLDPARVWKGVKADLRSLDRKKLGDRKYMVGLVSKILDAESLLQTVGMVHWLRQEDKIPEYEDLLTKDEKIRWIEMRPSLTGTPWENFKSFLMKTRDIYEELARSGTKEMDEEPQEPKKCTYCKRSGHTFEECRQRSSTDRGEDRRKECFECGTKGHLARDCQKKGNQASHKIIKNKNKKTDSEDQEVHSNYLRVKDCRWCNRTYNSAFSCAGCGKQWTAKTKADHCLAHCVKFAAATPKEKGEMVIKAGNCLICLHHEHVTDSCFGKDQQRTICGMDNCQKRHHPSLHSAPQTTIQAVQVASHALGERPGDLVPGVGDDMIGEVVQKSSASVTSVLENLGQQGKFLARVSKRRDLVQKVSWVEASWVGGTKVRIEEARAKELEQMTELLKLPVVDGSSVLLLMQDVSVKYGPAGDTTQITVFWDNGSTCSLIQISTAEMLGCPGEPVTVSIDTVNGIITRNTKLYCVELLNHAGERVTMRAFGVENISDVRSLLDLTRVKGKFSDEVQTQWGKISKRPHGPVHLLVGEEYAGYHPVQLETRDNLVVCRTMFGQGWMITGCDPELEAEVCTWGGEVAAIRMGRVTVKTQSNHRISVSTHPVRLTFTQDRDFYTLDNLGIEPARRCPSCKGCKECSWRGQKMSRKEAYELEIIEKGVEYKDGRFHIQFPFLVDPMELADNYYQVVKIAEVEERRLEKEGRMNEFNELFSKLQELGAVEEISDHELKTWGGPVHYVSLQHVIAEGNSTTSFRIVSNSSLRTPGNPHSLNSILAKGPNMLTDPYKIMVRFRTYLKGLNSDVTKAYYQLFTGLLEKHVRRIVWRYGVKGAKWRIFGYLCVSFGDTPAAALLEVCFRLVIVMFGVIDQLAAQRLLNDRFVDDITSGGDADQVKRFKGEEDPETLTCSGTMPQIFDKANLKLKAIAVSGEEDGKALEKLSGSVLGHGYSTERDTLTVRFKVNITPRRRGNPTGPDLTRDTLAEVDRPGFVLTRRIVLGIANGQFDMIGITTPLLIKYKASMRDLFVKELGLSWDNPLPEVQRKIWISYIKELVLAGQFDYKRCARPAGVVTQFWLVVFFDGSDEAYAVVVYCRWEMDSGEIVITLLCSKARTVPLLRISTPRSELCGAVLAIRQIWTIVQALEFEEKPTKILIGGDSETVLAAREKAVGALGEYFGNRIGECWDLQSKIEEIVPVGIEGQGEWYHMPSQDNAADRPSRIDSKVEDLVEGSEWQQGKAYMLLPFAEWPWERNFSERKVTEVVPEQELAAKYRWMAAGNKVIKEEENPIVTKFDGGFVTNDYDVLINMTEPYFRWIARIRAKKEDSKLTLTSRDMAVRFWYQMAMAGTREAWKKGRLQELTLQEKHGMLVIEGRASAGMKQLLGAEYLPVVMASERIAVLVMLKSHDESDHKSVDITLSTSRHHCWIVGGRRLAKTVCKFCIRCRYLRRKEETQKMAPLPQELCVPCPAFSNVGVDLAGPYKVQSMLKKRSTRGSTGSLKVWAVLVVCLNTRALKIFLAPGYSTEDFMIAWKNFESDCGIPRRVHSDRGSQLISAAGEIDVPDFNWEVISQGSRGQTTWTFCPSGAQWRNGSVESFVKRFKKSLELYKHSGLNYAELGSMFRRIAAVLNTRPISARYGPRHADSDPDYLEVITPSMLLTGRTGVDLPAREYQDEKCPLRRLAHKQELERAWWQQWKVQCFDSLLPTKSWTQEQRGVKQGDVVLISYSDKSKTGTFRLGIVEEIETDPDGLVRTCLVGYRLVRSDMPVEELKIYFKGLKWKQLRVPVQRLCIILPVEEYGVPEYLRKAVGHVIEENVGIKPDETEEADMIKETELGIRDEEKQVEEELIIEDIDDTDLNDEEQIEARKLLVSSYQVSLMKKQRVQKTSRSVKILHRKYLWFERMWKTDLGEIEFL